MRACLAACYRQCQRAQIVRAAAREAAAAAASIAVWQKSRGERERERESECKSARSGRSECYALGERGKGKVYRVSGAACLSLLVLPQHELPMRASFVRLNNYYSTFCTPLSIKRKPLLTSPRVRIAFACVCER